MNETRVLDVVQGELAILAADPELLGYLDTDANSDACIYERMSVDEVQPVNGLYWYLLPISAEETTERCIVRWDIYCKGTALAFLIEGCLRRLLHFEYPVTINGVLTFSQITGSIDAIEGIAGQDDIAHRVVENEIQPVRLRART